MSKRIAVSALAVAILMSAGLICNAVSVPGTQYMIHSETFVLMHAETGQVIFQGDMDVRMNPASITKVMTALLAIEYGKLSEVAVASAEAIAAVPRDTSHMALDVGEEMTIEELLYGLAIVSANDAANVIAEHIAGSMDAFAIMMTNRAIELGAKGTNFVNANGLTDENHYTTAYDMALIMSEAIKHPEFLEFFNCVRHETPPTNLMEESRIYNSKNQLIAGDGDAADPYPELLASKTGWTTPAQHTLVSAAARGGETYVVVSMKTVEKAEKYNDTIALFEYAFANYTHREFTAAQLSMEEVLEDGTVYAFTAEDGYSAMMPKDVNWSEVTMSYNPALGKGVLSGLSSHLGTVDLAYIDGKYAQVVVSEPDIIEGIFGGTDAGGPKSFIETSLDVVLVIGLVCVAFFAMLFARRMYIMSMRKKTAR